MYVHAGYRLRILAFNEKREMAGALGDSLRLASIKSIEGDQVVHLLSAKVRIGRYASFEMQQLTVPSFSGY